MGRFDEKIIIMIKIHVFHYSKPCLRPPTTPSIISLLMQVKIITRDERDIEFDMIGYDPSIVNALRR